MVRNRVETGVVGLAVAAVMGCAGMASADVVRVSTEGRMTQVSNFGSVMVTDAFSFWFDVDLSISMDSAPHLGVGRYEGAVVSFGASVGSFTVAGTDPGSLVIEHYSTGHESDIDAVSLGLNSDDHFSHEFIRTIDFELIHLGGDYFSSTNLDEVLGVGDLSVWDVGRSIYMTGSTPNRFALGEITSISLTTIPAPSSLAMLGCFGAVATRRRR
ncbi:MAG: hypothetical protein ACSHX5_05875 [Phycisphaerales bacterium]